jgi:chromosome partitioning protein
MRTIAILSQKGGSGRTTLTLHLAVAALYDGQSVAIIDLDRVMTPWWCRSPIPACPRP